MPCDRRRTGKVDFYSPAVRVPIEVGGVTGGFQYSRTAVWNKETYAGHTIEAPFEIFSDQGRDDFTGTVDATDYGVIGADYLTEAHNDSNAPGHWEANFNINITWQFVTTTTVPSGWDILGLVGVAFPDTQQTSQGSIPQRCPWPLPYEPYMGNSLQATGKRDDLGGIKFVDQFANQFPINPNLNPVFLSTGIPYAGDFVPDGYVRITNPIPVACGISTVLNGGFGVPEVMQGKTKLLCYPKFTWDSTRMGEIADWFMQWPALIRLRNHTSGALTTVGGRLSIDAETITYGPVHFVLNRPICKVAGILSGC